VIRGERDGKRSPSLLFSSKEMGEMTVRNCDGHSNQTDRSPDVMNILEEAERALHLSEIFKLSGESIDLPDIKRAVNTLEADHDVATDRTFANNWLVEVV
jgi:hypothetical protein